MRCRVELVRHVARQMRAQRAQAVDCLRISIDMLVYSARRVISPGGYR